jgi:hypothetical protein
MISMASLREVRDESVRQDKKWGEQNHPDGTGRLYDSYHATKARQECDRAFAEGVGTWRHILKEEFCEALEETDPEKLKDELLQVAAVALQWRQAIGRRLAREVS